MSDARRIVLPPWASPTRSSHAQDLAANRLRNHNMLWFVARPEGFGRVRTTTRRPVGLTCLVSTPRPRQPALRAPDEPLQPSSGPMSQTELMSFAVAPEAYDRFMGRYSVLLAPQMASFACIAGSQRVLDVGCGPGALTTELVRRLGPAGVIAVDPSEGLSMQPESVWPASPSKWHLRNICRFRTDPSTRPSLNWSSTSWTIPSLGWRRWRV